MNFKKRILKTKILTKILKKISKISKLLMSFMLSCVFFANTLGGSVCALGFKPDFGLEAKGCYLFNVDTNTVVYQKNKDLKLEPASLVKIMTAILVLEKIKDIDATIVTAKPYIFNELYGRKGMTAGIVKGEELSVRQLLQCMLTQSACEAAMMLADAVCPDDIDSFVDMMNAKARKLGAKNTNFTNPHGIHDDSEYSTAYDMFLMTKYAMELPAFMDIVSQTAHEIPATNKRDAFSVFTTIEPMKKSSKYYYSPIRGVKTGTEESGRSFVSTASKDGFTYICCVLGAPYRDEKTGEVIAGNKAFEETVKLYQWAFENFNLNTIITADSPITEVALKYVLKKDHLKIAADKNVLVLIPKDVDVSSIKTTYNLPDQVYAPVGKGENVGTAKVFLKDQNLAEFNLVSFETVERTWFVYVLSVIKNLTDFIIGKTIVVVLFLFLVFLVLVMIVRKRAIRRQKRRRQFKKNQKNNIFK